MPDKPKFFARLNRAHKSWVVEIIYAFALLFLVSGFLVFMAQTEEQVRFAGTAIGICIVSWLLIFTTRALIDDILDALSNLKGKERKED